MSEHDQVQAIPFSLNLLKMDVEDSNGGRPKEQLHPKTANPSFAGLRRPNEGKM